MFSSSRTSPQILFSLTQGAKLNLNIFPSLTSNPQEVPLLPNSVWPAAVPCFGNQLATKLVINFNAANLNLFSGPEFQRKHFGVFHRTWNEILDSDQKTTIENIWRWFMGEIKPFCRFCLLGGNTPSPPLTDKILWNPSDPPHPPACDFFLHKIWLWYTIGIQLPKVYCTQTSKHVLDLIPLG